MAEGDTLVNALIGAVVSVVASSFIPFAPVLGGVLVGYLQGGSRREGVRVGAISGGIAFVPVLGIMFVVLSFVGFVSVGSGEGAALAVGGVIVVIVALVLLVYTVGLSALGGWVGNYVKYETNVDI